MRYTTRNEIEYLGALNGTADEDPKLISEMWQRLDALRRFDQNFSDADWHPHGGSTNWRPDSPTKFS